MVNVVRTRRNSNESPRTDIGEIDTRAPFRSVRAAVSLFGEESSSPSTKPISFKKSKSHGVLDKEAEFHFTHKELGKFKSQVKNAESAANKALPELEKAMKTLLDLKDKIKAVNASKESIMEDIEALRIKAKELEQEKSCKQDGKGKIQEGDDLYTSQMDYYKAAAVELDAAKQELSNLHGDFDSAMDAKLSALQMAEEAQLATKANSNKVTQLSAEIERMKNSLDEMKVCISKTSEEQAKVSAEKEGKEQAFKIGKEELERKIHDLLQERETEGLNGAEALELKLVEMNKKIEVLKEQITQAKEALSESERNTYSELNSAREGFKQAEREKQSLQEAAEVLKLELADVGKEISETKEKEDWEQLLENNLKVELQETKMELEAALAREVKEADDSNEMQTKIEKLLMEDKQAKEEAREMSSGVEELRREAEGIREMERKLQMAEKEAEEAKAAERNAQDELKIVSERNDVECAAVSDERYQKKELFVEEYEALKKKVSESEKMAETKVASTMAEMEELRARKNKAEKKLSESLTEIEEMDRATEEAFKQAELAEAAKSMAQRELRRLRNEKH